MAVVKTKPVPTNGAAEECKCAETQYTKIENGNIVTKRVVPRNHSCEYVRKRNELIPEAASLATAEEAKYGKHWSAEFSRIMNELVRDKMQRGEM